MTSQFERDTKDLQYNKDRIKSGRCIILNYKTFDDPKRFSTREGTENDTKELENTFSGLNFKVAPFNDLTYNETLQVLKEGEHKNDGNIRTIIRICSPESKFDHNAYDCFILCILTHGNDGGKCVISQFLSASGDIPNAHDEMFLLSLSVVLQG